MRGQWRQFTVDNPVGDRAAIPRRTVRNPMGKGVANNDAGGPVPCQCGGRAVLALDRSVMTFVPVVIDKAVQLRRKGKAGSLAQHAP